MHVKILLRLERRACHFAPRAGRGRNPSSDAFRVRGTLRERVYCRMHGGSPSPQPSPRKNGERGRYVAADRDHRWRLRRSNGIPGGRRSGPNDRPGLDAGGGPPGDESPAGCHCNEWRPPAACAAARQRAAGLLAGILRASRTSLTSTSAGRGRPVRSSGQLGRDHPSTQARSARPVLLCCGVTSPGIAGLLPPELLLPMCLMCRLVD
ncbi:hypothetical protein AB7M56_008728 [Bradyrhizobium elkanii]|nr:hypothetical protein [Bradyrhizobium elkanii]MCS3521899.1 hypothetical protein [Bradyrhizobium elkanii]MCS4069554.1 hypothetical protein [Bradyrhizobium elkanii]MCS4076184.1 hypothetical protein [Bradyrhizobium elkanii]MCS4103690.1 hypothetical protein [Bradyrhizobium elkanii]